MYHGIVLGNLVSAALTTSLSLLAPNIAPPYILSQGYPFQPADILIFFVGTQHRTIWIPLDYPLQSADLLAFQFAGLKSL